MGLRVEGWGKNLFLKKKLDTLVSSVLSTSDSSVILGEGEFGKPDSEVLGTTKSRKMANL